ncbi:hypothetical protein NPX13_g2466 [Xylaria arbuscula]|uniref:C2H2-type domain-containing protein n=1 Tax=Xylaria arbuscula TaxID=114810 RepID=A0A9W8NK57_9PEZI|nr:hypothetical protein NPX13_g2466 [Xylaria arbuscula]
METAHLKTTGAKIYEAFGKANHVENVHYASAIQHLQFQKERFQLWARSLGLFQQGHVSLDYRVRDAFVIKQSIYSMLQMLLENLEELVSVILGHRSPFEDQRRNKSQGNEVVNEHNNDETDYSDGDPSSSEGSSTLSDGGNPLNEGNYRLQLIHEAIDSLYCLATQIRNPKNRPQKTLDQMCRHIPSQERVGYIRDLEKLEIMIVAYVQRQQVLDLIDDSPREVQEDILSLYCLEDSWLMRRVGVANARRKLQFTYWKQHTQRLGDPTIEPREEFTMREKNKQKGVMPLTAHSMQDAGQSVTQPENSVPQQSMATSATHMPPGLLKPHDATSVISHQSRVSTMVSPKGDKIAWPHPPARLAGKSKFFSCPYCFLICPDAYLDPDPWRNHLVHDLQPYHCTYQYCQDPNRLYGSKQEWLDHESQHTRVWHCQNHVEEFETQPEYIEHLKQDHEDAKPEQFSAELLSSVVGPSVKLNRFCPFCPTGINSLIEMQRHLAFYMERLALLALPRNESDTDDDRASNASDESHEAQQRGRKRSIYEDFSDKGDFTIDRDSGPRIINNSGATNESHLTINWIPPDPESELQHVTSTASEASRLSLSEHEDIEMKPESFNRLRLDERHLRFLEAVRLAPDRPLQPIRSPAYPLELGLLAPESMEPPEAQGYVEYLGRIPPVTVGQLQNDQNDSSP